MSCLVVVLALAVFAGIGYFIGILKWGSPSAGVASGIGSMLAALIVVYVLVNVRK